MNRMLHPKAIRSVVALALVAGVAGIGSAWAADSRDQAQADVYCADLPDTVGLYKGNPITQMGYPIGTITAIEPQPKYVRVEFSVTAKRLLPVDVKAIIRSPTILADRSMELVGNYAGGETLKQGACIPLDRTISPKTISEVIGSADTFLNEVNSAGSKNVADTISGVDRLAHNNGSGAGQLLRGTSALLDSPDQAVSDIGSIVRNTSELTSALKDMRDPLKEILHDSLSTTGDLVVALDGAGRLAGVHGYGSLGPLIETVAVIQTRLGDLTQTTLDAVSDALRKATPHSQAMADLLNPVPWWINTLANHVNGKEFGTFNIAYRPPLFRVPTHDGLAVCGAMNASMPGSCADVNGQPYAVDVSLLQYVLTQASRR